MLARALDEGDGLTCDDVEAARVMSAECERGAAFLCWNGQGVAPDRAEALRMWTKACGDGLGAACAAAKEAARVLEQAN